MKGLYDIVDMHVHVSPVGHSEISTLLIVINHCVL